jgi:Bacillus/Clostridium GerA spore germination protein
MNSFLLKINESLGDNDDFFQMSRNFGEVRVELLGLKSLIDVNKTIQGMEDQVRSGTMNRDGILQTFHNMGGALHDEEEVTQAILKGKLILSIVDEKRAVICVDAVAINLNRSIESPTNENTLQGPLSSFNEDLDTNIGIIRKQVVSKDLDVKSYTVGTGQERTLSVVYRHDHANMELVRTVIQQIESNKEKSLHTIQDVTKMLGLSIRSLISSINTTEAPQEVYRYLEKGKVVLFLDRIPFALILPSDFWDMFFLENDRNYSSPIMVSVRLLRIVGTLLALVLPGLYVALVAVNPEMLRIELALSVAQTREGVPYPAFVETILMLLILELIMEASIRLPKSIGPTITMVGGIILGQAVVEARLVSNLLIIILAATTIANSTIVGFQNSISIRIFKYLILILSSIFGVFGILAGLFVVSAYVAGISTFGVPYLNLKGDSKSG